MSFLLAGFIVLLGYGIYLVYIKPRFDPLRKLPGPPVRQFMGNLFPILE
jgi:hypothetical protein